MKFRKSSRKSSKNDPFKDLDSLLNTILSFSPREDFTFQFSAIAHYIRIMSAIEKRGRLHKDYFRKEVAKIDNLKLRRLITKLYNSHKFDKLSMECPDLYGAGNLNYPCMLDKIYGEQNEQ